MVSYCGQSMSVVRRGSCVVRLASCVVRHAASAIALKAYSSYTPPIPLVQLTRYLEGSIRVTCRSKIANIVRSEIQDGRHLENLFFASSPEPKGQLTSNLLGSIRVTCRSKIAKIVPIRNPRWMATVLKIYFSLLLLIRKAT